MLTGVGIGYRPAIAGDLVARPRAADFLEVLAESCAAGARRREARALSEAWPVVVHGVSLSLGSAEGPDDERARGLGAAARELRAECITEHVAFVRAGGRAIGHLTMLPMTRDAVRVLARNVARVRRRLPDVPLLLENVAWTLRWPEDEMAEPDFYAEVARATGCDLLLDVANLYANARNAGRDPVQELARFPLDHVRMVHVAGGMLEDGFWYDTHAAAVPDDVYALAARALSVTGGLPVVLERDSRFPPFAMLEREIERLRVLVRQAPQPSPAYGTRNASIEPPRNQEVLHEGQLKLAEALAVDDPAPREEERFGAPALRRARRVLRRKLEDERREARDAR
jgi:uncharacterized protein (UPF0276 family)